MTEEQVKIIKEDYLKFLKENIQEEGSMSAHISVFADIVDSEDNKPALVEIPIPDEYLKDDDAKEHFVEEILPQLVKEFKKRFIAHSVVWSAEAWLRTIPKEKMATMENYKDFPITTEAVVIIIDSKDGTEAIIYEIQRPSLSISTDGELVEKEQKNKIELIEMPELSGSFNEAFTGRFSNLYKKFTD